MPSHVVVNGLGLTYKSAIGISIATIPDVCKTPSPGGPIPLPYPNIANQGTLTDGTTTVFAKGGKMIAIKGSQYAMSSGDEPGTVGGVKSNVFKKATDWITYSFDVKMDGKNACRHTDKKFHNDKNTVNLAGNGEPVKPAGLSAADSKKWDDCTAQHKKYKDLQAKNAEHRKDEYKALKEKVRLGTATAGTKRELLKICNEKELIIEEIIKERVRYVVMGCDKIHWYPNDGSTEATRRARHSGEIKHVKEELANLREYGSGLL